MYAPNQPESKLSPSDTQNQIKLNFSVFSTAFAVNHGNMATNIIPGLIQGKHKAVIMKMQPQGLGVQEGFASLFGRIAVQVSGNSPNLFWKTEKKADGLPINSAVQLTFNKVQLTGNDQQTFIPGGFIVYKGIGPIVSGSGSFVITLPLGTATSKIMMANAITNTSTLSGNGTDTANALIDPNNLFVTFYYNAPTPTQFNYLIIGRV